MSNMDRSRARSAARDATKKPEGSQLRDELAGVHESWAMDKKLRRQAPGKQLCPDCRHSTAFLHWDKRHGYYIHAACGRIVFSEELFPEEES